MNAAIEVRGAVVVRGTKRLLDDVSLTVSWGEVAVLVGPNGAGKSTLLNAIAGDIALDAGTIALDGRPLGSITSRQRAQLRAVLPQQTTLQFAFTAREVVAMGRAPLPAERAGDDEAAILASLAATETDHLAGRAFPSLSGGEQHRVSLARVLAQETSILLLDEPTAALDIRHQNMVMATARATAARGGSVLAVLHDLNLALAYADRIGVLRDGRLVAFDTPREIARSELLSEVFEHPIAIAPGSDERPIVVPGVLA